MILRRVQYAAEDLALVIRYEAVSPKLAAYWSDDECNPIRASIKHHYRTAQGNTCCYCRQVLPVNHGAAWHAEHVVPRESHPEFMFTPENLALACPDCNLSKSNKQTLSDPSVTIYPDSGDAFLVVHPHFDEYQIHVEQGGYTYVSLSEKGEWTIRHCNLARFAGMQFGWPEPVNDDRYEAAVEELFGGDVGAANQINSDLRDALRPTSKP